MAISGQPTEIKVIQGARRHMEYSVADQLLP